MRLSHSNLPTRRGGNRFRVLLAALFLLGTIASPAAWAQAGDWTSISGSTKNGDDGGGQPPVYANGEAIANPGARAEFSAWMDSGGNFWLFGGYAANLGGTVGPRNDLWEYSVATKIWTWVGGSSTLPSTGCTAGVYGTKGTASAANAPGSRADASAWTDSSGNFWLFGGFACDSTGVSGYLNDLWEFTPSTKAWTWVGGPNTITSTCCPSIFGATGTAAAGNLPGGRRNAITWTGSNGNLWLFGGFGLISTSSAAYLNDLWEYNIASGEWTRYEGSETGNAGGVYGTAGIAAAGNLPGSRTQAVGITDESGNLWLFGGSGYGASSATLGDLNDLWMYSPASGEWTWVGGSQVVNAASVFGSEGVAAGTNVPGARNNAVGWKDESGNLWVFGGESGAGLGLNDLWAFHPETSEWTWVGGSQSPLAAGVYGTQGVASATNIPGARYRGYAVTDAQGNAWLYGGDGEDSVPKLGVLNDLWKYQPASVETAAATPAISPAGGTYNAPQTVTITDATGGATIYYSTNGAAPTTTSTKYTAAIPVSAAETIEAIAVAPGYANSSVSSATFALQAAAPAFSPAAGSYTSSQTVAIADATPGATIYYTTNGTTPTTSSAKYTGPITVSATETIEAIAVATGYSQSVVAAVAYTIPSAPAIVAVSPVSAQATQTITISGSAFGTHAAYTGESSYIGIWDVTEGDWGAGYGEDGIGLVVSSWTNTAITLGGFTNLGAYNATLRNGDELLIKVWNPSTGAGPAVCAVIVGSAATVCAVLDDSGVISTLAGNGTRGYSGDGGAATSAELTAEDGVAVDAAGNVYIADTYNARIRKVTPAGVIATIAGNGSVGYLGNGGAATSAELNYPTSVAVDKTGNVYFTDSGNNAVRKISTAGVITTVAGNGTAGYSGDGGAATSAELNGPAGVAVDSSGNLYISDSGNQRVRLVTASTGKISTIAGNGTKGYAGDGGAATSAELGDPYGIALDASNNVYIADSINFRVRKVTTAGVISTVAGTGAYGYSGDGGAATSAQLTYINAIAVDSSGNLYLYDSNNYRVRKVNPSGIIATVAGNGVSGYQGDGGPAIYAEMTGAYGLAVDGSGNLYVADTGNNVIRKVTYASAAPAAPVFSPAGGNFTAATSVAITDASSGAALYYSISTSSSSTGWSAYTGPVTVSGSETVEAVAIASNGQQTASSAKYVFPTATPVISPAAGAYTTFQAVTITDATVGASIYYTLNGTTPSPASSPLYTGPLTLSGAVKVTAVAIAPGSSVSAAATASYTLPSPAVSLSPASVAFGSQAAGSNTAKIVTLQNTGAGYLSLSGIAITGSNLPEFSQTNNCPSSLAPSASCTVTVTFLPQAASSYAATLAITDNAPASPQQVSLTGAGTGVRIITTVAGLSRSAYGNGGPATTAELNYPNGAAVDSAGNVYLADMNNNQIRKLNPATGLMTAVAGTGQAGYSGNGQLAVNAQLASPQAVAIDAAGNLYIADSGNFVVRKVTAATGILSTIAGNGKSGDSGDGGQAIAASFGLISAIAVDSAGNLYLADIDNGVVRKITASTGIISTFVASAQDITPQGLAVDSAGNLYVSDGNNSQVDKVAASSGAVTVFAGTGGFGNSGDGGPATGAELESPEGLWFDAAQDLYISDAGAGTVRKVTSSTGVIGTVAGNGTAGFSGDGGAAKSAALNYPAAAVGNASGALYIVDYGNNRVRALSASGTISTVAGNGLFSPIASGVSALTQPLLIYQQGGLVEDKTGNLYFTDENNNAVRKISTAGVITTIAGNGQSGYAGDGGAATSAMLSGPSGIALDAAGNVYIADTNNQLVRKVTASTGIITTIAGTRACCVTGDGGPATSAYIANPTGLVVDAAGNLYIAERYGCAVRKVTPAGIISTVAGQESNCDYSSAGAKTGDGGPATSAVLNFQLSALALDAQGNLYLAGASTVREVTAASGIINTVVGGNGTGATDAGDGGLAVNASLNQIHGLAFDPSGNLYIADGTVRMVNRSGIISTIGPQGGSGYSGDGGPVASAQAQVAGVFADGAGDIYIADASGNRVRKISTASAAQAVAATPSFAPAAGSISTLQAVTLSDATPGAQIFYTLDGSTPSPFTSSLYTGPLNLLGTVKLSAIAIAPGYSTSAAQSGSFTVSAPQTATPAFSVAAGTYTAAQTVTITDATSGATIYYTTNGTAPTTNSTRYTGAITVASTETIEAMAAASGYTNSAVASVAYTIAPPAATPVFSPVAGTYTSAQTVTITDATSGAIIYYTTNGVTPTASSTKYAGPITVSSTETIEAVAVATGYSQSAVGTAAYTIVPKAAAPTFTPAAGTYGEAQLVTLASATPGATIYYTLNGTTPTTSSTQYTGPVGVKSTETITAIAVLNGYTNSPAAVAAYTLVDSPQALTGLASPIATTTATLNATASDSNVAGQAWFVWGTSKTALTSTTAQVAVPASASSQSLTVPLTGLVTKTTYYFQPVITTIGGTAYGAIQSFTTN